MQCTFGAVSYICHSANNCLPYTEVRGASSIIIIIQMRFVTRAFAPGEVNGIMITIDRVTDCDIIEMAMISIISSQIATIAFHEKHREFIFSGGFDS